MEERVAADAQNGTVQETQLLDAAQSLRNARSSLRVIVEELLRDLRNAQEALQAYELPERYWTQWTWDLQKLQETQLDADLRPPRIVLFGNTGAGKSTLLKGVIGQRIDLVKLLYTKIFDSLKN